MLIYVFLTAAAIAACCLAGALAGFRLENIPPRLEDSLTGAAAGIMLCAAVLVLYILFYHRLFAITFDESFSRATGVRVGLYNTILSVLTALTIVLGMRMMGTMLISSLVIFPALSAMRMFKSFRSVTVCAAVLSVFCALLGILASILAGTPVGSTIVAVQIGAFGLSWLAGTVLGGVRR